MEYGISKWIQKTKKKERETKWIQSKSSQRQAFLSVVFTTLYPGFNAWHILDVNKHCQQAFLE